MWAWAAQCLLALIGLSAGVAVAAGLFSFIVELGVVADFADRTHTGEHILLYEDCVALGGILGNLVYVFQIRIPLGDPLFAVYGIFAGIFTGCWAMALAEILQRVPGLYEKAEDRAVYDCVRDQYGAGERTGGRAVLLAGVVTG